MIYPNLPPFYVDTHESSGLGGSESGFLNTFHELIKQGHRVDVYNRWPLEMNIGQWSWNHIKNFNPNKQYDVVYVLRHADMFDRELPNVGLKVLFLADTESIGLGKLVGSGKIDLVMAVSHWQKEKIAAEEEIHNDNWMITSNGLTPDDGAEKIAKYRGRCLFTATPERGLSTLLDVWPRILEKVPWATLEIFSSYVAWGEAPDAEVHKELGEREYKRAADLNVINSFHGGAKQLRLAQSLAEFYLYPTNFRETRCMSVLEAMYQQAVPIVTGRAALLEEVLQGITGFVVPGYGADSPRYRDLFVNTVVEQLTRDPNELLTVRAACRRYAEQYLYPDLVKQWASEWEWRLMDKGWKFT